MSTAKVRHSVPGPPSRLGPFMETLRIFYDPIAYMDRHFAKYGPIAGGPTAPLTTPPRADYPGTVFVYGPDLLREISSNHDGYARSALSHRLYPAKDVTPRTRPLQTIMTGLTHQRGDTHRAHRRLILPALQKHTVTTYFDDMVSETQALIGEWQPGETYDMSREMVKLTLRISARSLFGQTGQTEGQRIGRLIDHWVDFIMSVGHLFPFDLPGMPYRKWLDLSHEIEVATRQLIEAKRAAGADDSSLLSRLIQATADDGEGFSEEDLVGHISLMLWGSRDAAAAALMWTLFLVSLHPAVHEAVVDEVESKLAGTPPSPEQLAQLSRVESALKESLRILPPFPMLNRVSTKDQHLGQYQIPEGTEIIMSIYHTQRMPELYERPDAFLPQRWDDGERPLFTYVPFGGGPRMCPGMNFAWQELTVVSALIWQRYRLEIVDNARVDRVVKLALLPKQGLPMTVHRQDRKFGRSAKPIRGNLRQMVSTLPG